MIETIKIMMQYEFMQRAVIVGVLVSLCAALLGVILVGVLVYLFLHCHFKIISHKIPPNYHFFTTKI